MIRITPVSECDLMIKLGDDIDTELATRTGYYSQRICQSFGNELQEVNPSYTTIHIQYHPLKISYARLKQMLEKLLVQPSEKDSYYYNPNSDNANNDSTLLELPVYYAPETGPDLAFVANCHGLTVNEVIQYHSQPIYTVCAIGFAPGFAFMATVDPLISTPRRKTPRVYVPAGSVGIADSQTAVYPTDTPGGWQILGNCPVKLFDPERKQFMPFTVGQKVRFHPVCRDVFLEQGGSLCPVWK